MTQRSGRRSRTPPGRGDVTQAQAARPIPIERPSLAEMTPAERAEWYGWQAAELADFASYAQEWEKRRERQGRQNDNDDRYQKFFSQAADLLRGLEELRQEAVAQVQIVAEKEERHDE